MAWVIPHLFLLLPLLVYAQTDGRIRIGSSLIAGDASAPPWQSPSNDFALGFQEVDDGLFLFSIWYNKLPEKTIVWFARHPQNPVPRGSKLQLTASDGLLLQSSHGGELWKPGIFSGTVAYGVMNNTGNFMLVDSSFKPLWESFKQPTDTLLPTQKLEMNDVLSSCKSKNNYSLGKFQFRLSGGDAVLNVRSLPSELTYDPYSVTKAMDGYQIVLDKDGFLYILQRNESRVNISEPEEAYPATTHHYKVTLNFDGVLTISHHPKNLTASSGTTWRDFKKIPDNICMDIHGNLDSGTCGYNSICTLNEDQRPSCKCPPGYSLIDPNDEYGSCKPNIAQICEEGAQNSTSDLYTLQDLPNTDWPMLDYEQFSPFTVEECKNACLLDCLCVVAVYRGGNCWKKKLPLANGREDKGEKSISYLKLRRNDSFTDRNLNLLDPKANKDRKRLIVVIYVLLGCSIFFLLMMVSLISWGFIFYHKKKLAGSFLSRESFESSLRRFTYEELRKATTGFKEELGRGSCGIVYKGLIESGPVAVKKLDRVFEDSEKEFKTEVNVIGQTHHKNLVRLLGYCDEGRNRILIYEFMSKGTLASFLFGDRKLSWNLRAQVAYGIARGLSYLHEECNTQIIHCDIKPQNVLLDEQYNVKISDFGLSKLLKMDQSRTETGIRGTKGYVAPDWFRSAPVTAKVDVYSFGVLLLEIICCRRNADVEVFEEGSEILVDWAYDCFYQGRLDALMDGDLEAIDDMRRFERFVMVALWCLQEDPSQRPAMKRVVLMLEGIIDVAVPPSPCSFTSTSTPTY